MPRRKNEQGQAPVEKKPLPQFTRQCGKCGGHKQLNGKQCTACRGRGWVTTGW